MSGLNSIPDVGRSSIRNATALAKERITPVNKRRSTRECARTRKNSGMTIVRAAARYPRDMVTVLSVPTAQASVRPDTATSRKHTKAFGVEPTRALQYETAAAEVSIRIGMKSMNNHTV